MSNQTSSLIPAKQGNSSRVNSHQRTNTVRQRLYKEYGVDVGQVGYLTPQAVRASSVRVKQLKNQEKLAATYAKNAEKIGASLNQLEQTRVDMLATGSGQLKASDRMLSNAIMTNARLETSMKGQAAKLAGDLKIEELKSSQGLQQQQASLEGTLRTMAATHDAQLKLINYEGRENLKQGVASVKDGYQDARNNAKYSRDLNNYINGHGANTQFRLPSFSARGMFR